MQRKAKAATETGVYLAIIAAILVVVNVIAFVGLRFRVDTTHNERFTLSQGSGQLLRSLGGTLEVDAYVTKGLPKLDAYVRDLTDLLKLYERAGGGKLKFTIIEAKSDEQRQAAKEAGLREAPFGEPSETGEDQASITQGYMGLVFKYGAERTTIPMLSPERAEGLEFWITNQIREIRDKGDKIKHKVGVLTGHDEIKLTDTNLVPAQGQRGGPSMKGVIDQAFPFYEIDDVDLKNGDAEINKELEGVIITQPGKDFTDKELRRIDQFLMLGGKSLAVFASSVNLKPSDATMQATLTAHGLEKLLAGYGVEMKKDAVLDPYRSMQLGIPTETGRVIAIRDPAVIQLQHDPRYEDAQQPLDDTFAAFFRLAELSFPFPSSLVVHADKQPEAKLKVVARSPVAWSETTDTVELKLSPTWRPKLPLESKNIAVSVEGTLKAAMGAGDGVEMAAVSKDKSRVLVISSAQFLDNPFARSGAGQEMGGQFGMMGPVGGDEKLQMMAGIYAQRYITQTILAFKNTLDWMTGDANLIAVSAKLLMDPNLSYSDLPKLKIEASDDDASLRKKDEQLRDARKAMQRNVQWTLTLLCPLAFALFGVIRWRLREGGRADIKLT